MTTVERETRVRTCLLTQAEEEELARAVEAGVLAESCGELPHGTDAADLALVVERGRRARERLLLANHGLVVSIARAEARHSRVSVEELIQEGYVGLGEALARYDYRRGRFGVFAAVWVRHLVQRAARTSCGQSHLSRRQLAVLTRVRWAESELSQRLGRSVTTRELSEEVSLEAGWYRDYHEPLALEQTDVPDLVSPDPYADVVAVAWDAEELLAELPGLERKVVQQRCGIGCPAASYVRVGEELGMSSSSVRRIERRALARLRELLEESGAAA